MARPAKKARKPRGAAARAATIIERLAKEYPGTAKELCALHHDNPFQLLVATILSAQTTDENATQFVKAGQNEVTRATALYGLISHGNELYGTGAVYLRSKNIVPPSTERAGRGRGNNN